MTHTRSRRVRLSQSPSHDFFEAKPRGILSGFYVACDADSRALFTRHKLTRVSFCRVNTANPGLFWLPYRTYIFGCRIYIFGCRTYIFGCRTYIFGCCIYFWLTYIYFLLPYIYSCTILSRLAPHIVLTRVSTRLVCAG